MLLYKIVSGDFLAQISHALGQMVIAILLFFWTFCICTILSVLIALPFLRHNQGARILLIANAPSVIFLCYVAVTAVVSG
jgi:hypothetical protein